MEKLLGFTPSDAPTRLPLQRLQSLTQMQADVVVLRSKSCFDAPAAGEPRQCELVVGEAAPGRVKQDLFKVAFTRSRSRGSSCTWHGKTRATATW